MATFWEKVEGVVETWCPWILGLSLPLVYLILFQEHVTAVKFIEMNKLVIGVAAIGVGFLGTTKAIIVSITKSRVMVQLRQNGEYERLLRYLFTGVWFCLGLVLLSTLYMLVPFVDGEKLSIGLYALWFAVAGFATGACVRVIVIFNTILKVIK